MGAVLSDSQWASVALAALALAFSVVSTAISYWLVLRQNALAYQTFLNDKTQEISAWAAKVLDVLARMHEILMEGKAAVDHQPLLAELSSLIDVGRWYFPNYDHELIGTDKPHAYRGVRQYLLDVCVYAYDLFRDSSYGIVPGAASEMTRYRREFVSEMQLAINPRRLSKKDLQLLRQRAGAKLKTYSRDGTSINES